MTDLKRLVVQYDHNNCSVDTFLAISLVFELIRKTYPDLTDIKFESFEDINYKYDGYEFDSVFRIYDPDTETWYCGNICNVSRRIYYNGISIRVNINIDSDVSFEKDFRFNLIGSEESISSIIWRMFPREYHFSSTIPLIIRAVSAVNAFENGKVHYISPHYEEIYDSFKTLVDAKTTCPWFKEYHELITENVYGELLKKISVMKHLDCSDIDVVFPDIRYLPDNQLIFYDVLVEKCFSAEYFSETYDENREFTLEIGLYDRTCKLIIQPKYAKHCLPVIDSAIIYTDNTDMNIAFVGVLRSIINRDNEIITLDMPETIFTMLNCNFKGKSMGYTYSLSCIAPIFECEYAYMKARPDKCGDNVELYFRFSGSDFTVEQFTCWLKNQIKIARGEILDE